MSFFVDCDFDFHIYVLLKVVVCALVCHHQRLLSMSSSPMIPLVHTQSIRTLQNVPCTQFIYKTCTISIGLSMAQGMLGIETRVCYHNKVYDRRFFDVYTKMNEFSLCIITFSIHITTFIIEYPHVRSFTESSAFVFDHQFSLLLFFFLCWYDLQRLTCISLSLSISHKLQEQSNQTPL